ncbi:MAG: hypothetical protein COT61_05475, partial [Candidatus Portnoybacteria bacterium CG09_land_8_20_14_0_10_44_13]
DGDSGLYESADDKLIFQTNGSDKLTITTDGNVGIGTMTPAGKLHIAGSKTSWYSDVDTWTGIAALISTDATSSFDINNTTTGGDLRLYATEDIYFRTSSTDLAMTILKAGNVGIGTTSPASPLHVNGRVTIYSATDPHIDLGEDDNNRLAIDWDETNNRATFQTLVAGLNTGTLALQTNAGNVGIGTTTPGALFAVHGNALADAWLTYDIAEMNLFPSINSTGGFEPGELLTIDSTGGFVKANSSSSMPIIGAAKSVDLWGAPTTKPAILGTFNLKVSNASGAIKTGDRLTISSADGVAVKATAGGEVVGYALEDFDDSSPAKIKVFVSPQWYSGTTTPSSIVLSGEVQATGFVNVSTEEAKTNIEYLNEEQYDQALEKILGSKVARYDYIGDSCDSSIGNGNDARYVEGLRQTLPNNETGFVADNRCPRRIGLIAEEAPQEVLSADGKGVDLYKMTSLAWAGIKAQQKQIDALRMDVDELKNKIREMGGLSAGGGSALGGSFASVLDTLRGFGAIFENGVARFQQVIVGSLAVEKNSDSGQSAVGEGTIAAGQTEYQINSGQIKADSKVFVTWRGDYGSRWWIDQQADGSATVKIAAPLANDVRFDWMVIGVETAKSDSSSPQMRGGTEGGVLNENN